MGVATEREALFSSLPLGFRMSFRLGGPSPGYPRVESNAHPTNASKRNRCHCLLNLRTQIRSLSAGGEEYGPGGGREMVGTADSLFSLRWVARSGCGRALGVR